MVTVEIDPRVAWVVADLPVALVLVDDAGAVRCASHEASALFGRPLGSLLGRPIAELLSPAPVESAPDDPERECLGIRGDGGRFPAQVTTARLLDGRPRLRALVISDRSASHREAATRLATDERVRRLLETARVIPWEADVRTTQFTYVGPQAEAILGYPPGAWYETDFWPRHIHPDDRDGAIAICLAATSQKSHYSFEYRMIAADGRIVWIHDIVVVARVAGEPHLITGYMLDITASKQAEAERARLLAETRQALAIRDEFLDIAAHELHTPLTPLRLHLERAAHLPPGEANSAELQRHIDRALRQCDRLETLIDGMLGVARAGSEPLDLTRFDLGELVRDMVSGFAMIAERAGCPLRLDITGPAVGTWDRTLLEQALVNLLFNAVKYGPGRPIELTVAADDRCARLVVRDHGIGIAAADHERIFERFERAVPPTHYGGLGLGLYVARRVVHAHGGSITVASEPGHGATFTVELPLAPP